MNRKVLAGLCGVLVLLVVGAAAEVTRQDFDRLSAEVTALKAQVTAMNARLIALEKPQLPAVSKASREVEAATAPMEKTYGLDELLPFGPKAADEIKGHLIFGTLHVVQVRPSE